MVFPGIMQPEPEKSVPTVHKEVKTITPKSEPKETFMTTSQLLDAQNPNLNASSIENYKIKGRSVPTPASTPKSEPKETFMTTSELLDAQNPDLNASSVEKFKIKSYSPVIE